MLDSGRVQEFAMNTLLNNQYNADSSLNQNRPTPRTAGFGAANGALPMRNIQLELRLGF